MRITIKTHGHQLYHESTGEVLLWCQAVENFDGKPLQVPAVILKTDRGPLLVPLNAHLRWTEIEYPEEFDTITRRCTLTGKAAAALAKLKSWVRFPGK